MARLVICDDESHITDILSRFFTDRGHEVFGTVDGEAALQRITSQPVDLVITDVSMKGLSGFDLLRRMKEAGVTAPVIVTTGNPSHTSAVRALREGAFDYVVKPFHLEEIAERTERALQDKRMRDEHLLYSKLVSLHSISRILSEANSPEDLAAKVIRLGTRLTGSDAGWYWAIPAGPASAITSEANIRPQPETLEAHAFILRQARAAAEKCEALIKDSTGDLPGDPGWFLSLPVEVGSGIHGVLVFRRALVKGKFDAVDLEVFNQLASTFALAIRAIGTALPGVAAPTGTAVPAGAPALPEDDKAVNSWARLVGQMVDEHCRGYEKKGLRVASLGLSLMHELGWPQQNRKEWPLLCDLYDLSKLRVPQNLLDKRDPLEPDELEFIRAQSRWACESLSSIPGLEGVARILEDFQECFDGSGKPRGSRGHALAPQARVLAVADAFVALISERPYRPAFPEAEAHELVRRASGKRFDPEIVLALSKVRPV